MYFHRWPYSRKLIFIPQMLSQKNYTLFQIVRIAKVLRSRHWPTNVGGATDSALW